MNQEKRRLAPRGRRPGKTRNATPLNNTPCRCCGQLATASPCRQCRAWFRVYTAHDVIAAALRELRR